MRCFNPLTQIESGDSTPSTGKTVEDVVTLPLSYNNMNNISVVAFWSYSNVRSASGVQYYTGGLTLNRLCDGTELTLKGTIEALREVYGPLTYIRSISKYNPEEDWFLKEALEYGEGYRNPSRRHCLPVCENTWSYYKGREYEEDELCHTWHPQIGAQPNNPIWIMKISKGNEYRPISLEATNLRGVKYLHTEDEVYIASSLESLKHELTRSDSYEYRHHKQQDMFKPVEVCNTQIISYKKMLRLFDRLLLGESWT